MLHAGSADPSAANALEYLKGLWVEKTIVKHQRYHPCGERVWGGGVVKSESGSSA